MAYTLKQLNDLEAIKVLKHRYFRSIDIGDMAVLATLFTDDVIVEYRGGAYKVALTGKDNMVEFLANSFHSGVLAMHHGHMPEITMTGDNSATGIWYLEDIFIDLEENRHTFGTAIYTDEYRCEGGVWKISATTYDRVMEVMQPIAPAMQFTYHRLAAIGRRREERTDNSRFIQWDETI